MWHILFLLPCHLACFGWVDTATLDFRDSLLKRSEKSLRGRESLQPGMEPETMWKSWMEIQWDPVHCSRRGITGRKSSEKNILLLSGLNLSFRERGSWWEGLFSPSCQDFLLSDMRQNNFCLNFLLKKTPIQSVCQGWRGRDVRAEYF